MEILHVDLDATPIANVIRELSADSEWAEIDETSMDEMLGVARRLTSSLNSQAESSPLTPELRAFVADPVARWGLSVLRNLPAPIDPRRSLFLLSELMGNVVRFDDEGDYLIEVKEDLSSLVARPGFNNSKEFFPHTDLSYSDEPPVFFCLHSINNDVSQGGLSEFVDLRDIEKRLTIEQIETLRQADYLFPAPKHFRGGTAVRKAILGRGVSGADEIRFRRDNLRCTTRGGIEAVVQLCRTIQHTMTEVFLDPGSVAVIDNRRVLHGRTAFLGGSAAKIPRHINRLYFDLEPADGAFCD